MRDIPDSPSFCHRQDRAFVTSEKYKEGKFILEVSWRLFCDSSMTGRSG